VDDPRWTTSAAFIDYDRDGDQDLFLANYVAFTQAGNKVCTDRAGARDYCPPGAYAPVPTKLFRNDGGTTFTDVTESSGVARAYGAGLGMAVGDLDGDGWPDIYVANDATPNQLWINRHDGDVRGSRSSFRHGIQRARPSRRQHGDCASATRTRTVTRTCSSPTSSANHMRSI
jgi:hypothetical protein